MSSIEDSGYVAYVFFCMFGVGIFVHGLAVSCAGLTSGKSALSQSAYSIMSIALVLVQFYFVGYTLECATYAPHTHTLIAKFIGNFRHALLQNLDFSDVNVAGGVLLRCGFALVPCCVLASAACQRGRVMPLLIFLFAWMSLVYCPVARWCWQPSGWSYELGVLDYAGGTNIHVTAGFGALVYAYVLGPRLSYLSHSDDPPFSLSMVVQGTTLMLLGWIGFTGGSQISEPADAVLSVLNTCLSAAAGGFSWMLLDFYVSGQFSENGLPLERKYSILSFCSGTVSGLISITPGAGYVPPSAAPVFGVLGAVGCNYGTRLKFWLGVDDPLDVFAIHGIGGVIGTLLTGLFTSQKYRHDWQLLLQLWSVTTVALYTLVATYLIAKCMNQFKSLELRIPLDLEPFGVDFVENGESAATVISDGAWVQNDIAALHNPTNFGAQDLPLLQQLPLSYGLYSDGRA